MKNKNVLVWLLVVLAVAGAVFIGYTYRGTFLQGKMGPISGACDGKGCPVSGPVSGNKEVNDAINRAEFAKLLAVAIRGENVVNYNCKSKSFSDVSLKDWFMPYVCYMYDQDLMKGYADNTFGPAKTVTRAEAAKILVNASGADIVKDVGDAYSDVTKNTWYYDFVNTGAKIGLFDIKPWVGAKFYPGNTLSKGRAQLWINNLKKTLPK